MRLTFQKCAESNETKKHNRTCLYCEWKPIRYRDVNEQRKTVLPSYDFTSQAFRFRKGMDDRSVGKGSAPKMTYWHGNTYGEKTAAETTLMLMIGFTLSHEQWADVSDRDLVTQGRFVLVLSFWRIWISGAPPRLSLSRLVHGSRSRMMGCAWSGG